jgi:putative FmdB family regulatory protein
VPIYTYQCNSCGNQFDARESFSAPSIRDCTCGERQTARRVIQPVGIIYKGSGFYTTDYARKASSNGSNGSSAGEKSSGDSSSTSASEPSKSAAPSESSKAPAASSSDKS